MYNVGILCDTLAQSPRRLGLGFIVVMCVCVCVCVCVLRGDLVLALQTCAHSDVDQELYPGFCHGVSIRVSRSMLPHKSVIIMCCRRQFPAFISKGWLGIKKQAK